MTVENSNNNARQVVGQQSSTSTNPNTTTRKPKSRSSSPKVLNAVAGSSTSAHVYPTNSPTQYFPQPPPPQSSYAPHGVDHPTDGSPLEVSVMSDPAYKAYADLIASATNVGLSSSHPTPPEGSSSSSPASPSSKSKGKATASGAPGNTQDEQHDEEGLSASPASPQAPSSPTHPPTQHQLLQQVLAASSSSGLGHTFPIPLAYFGPNGSIIAAALPQLKTKRRQVKNACTNCQKACKKCDEARPCSRCVKYDVASECVDSQRKERKKGVKRGPYKKREPRGEYLALGFGPVIQLIRYLV